MCNDWDSLADPVSEKIASKSTLTGLKSGAAHSGGDADEQDYR